ncbi:MULTISPECIES: hypothetical protein [Protofrankia]|uniref:Tail sheath protein subtilisin-like domain-containing protein n=1 Tax=Candidatus Protofrankia datiscae TaxID=2716812 RepID=F8B1L1_9ACTN|nr:MULTISPECIES: hypothetical protein [Protofrankia]AEH10764.1 hypothetical protein FsymDg_3473 [Candidatus Protofrankia datiscae]
MSVPTAEYPYVKVTIDTSGLQPTATRAFGNVAVVGSAGGFGTAVPNTPVLVGSEAEARTLFADVDQTTGAIANKGQAAGPLYRSIREVLLQRPGASRVYAVATDDSGGGPNWAAALATIATAPVQLVSLARVTDPATLALLKTHVENASGAGARRIGVAMVDPDLAVGNGQTFADAADAAYGGLKNGEGRLVLVAARVATAGGVPVSDVAACAMATIAGYQPHISVLLKQVAGVEIPLPQQFTGTEVAQLAEKAILPLLDPEYIAGEGVFLGSGRSYNPVDPSRLYVDVVRVLDDLEFRLRGGLIGAIGNVRIDRLGMEGLRGRFDAILEPLRSARVIDGYTVDIPVLPILETEEADRSPGAKTVLTSTRTSRAVDVIVTVAYAGSVHFLDIKLALTV